MYRNSIMAYQVAIPSLGRSNTIVSKTIRMLLSGGIKPDAITVFVTEAEHSVYEQALDGLDVTVVTGEIGIRQQRHFIRHYYAEGTHVVSIDDDIEEVNLSLTEFVHVHNFFVSAFAELVATDSWMWGIYPVNNQFFQKQRQHSIKRGLSFIIGCLYGYINRYDSDLDITVSDGEKEDIELSLRTFIKDGSVTRYEHIAVKTKFYQARGGLGNGEQRIYKNNVNALALCEAFPFYTKLKTRKDGRHEITLTKLMERKATDIVTMLPAVDESLFAPLLGMLEKVKITWHVGAEYGKPGGNRRRGFPRHRAATIGIVKARASGDIGQSAFSKKHNDIHDEVFKIGAKICPFVFNAVHLNQNVVCPPHVDSNNASASVLVSFGEYSGGNIVVNGLEYNAYCQPVKFDGTKLIHWNTPLEEGSNKYSLVFYTHAGAAAPRTPPAHAGAAAPRS
jgi:hypothetical protein